MTGAAKPTPATVHVILPSALQELARCTARVELEVTAPVTQHRVLRALEVRYPELRGAILDHATGRRRPMLRFFAEQQDLSHAEADALLPASVAEGREPLIILGAIAGG